MIRAVLLASMLSAFALAARAADQPAARPSATPPAPTPADVRGPVPAPVPATAHAPQPPAAKPPSNSKDASNFQEKIRLAKSSNALDLCGRHSGRFTEPELQAIKELTNLKDLRLCGTGIADADLEHFRGLVNLEVLGLNSDRVGDKVLEIAACLPKLRVLYVANTKITDEGLKHLARSVRLEELYLEGNAITDAGIRHLQGLSGLKSLHLDGSQITDAGLGSLKGLAGIKQLSVRGAKVTREGVDQLKRSLPNCTVHVSFPRPAGPIPAPAPRVSVPPCPSLVPARCDAAGQLFIRRYYEGRRSPPIKVSVTRIKDGKLVETEEERYSVGPHAVDDPHTTLTAYTSDGSPLSPQEVQDRLSTLTPVLYASVLGPHSATGFDAVAWSEGPFKDEVLIVTYPVIPRSIRMTEGKAIRDIPAPPPVPVRVRMDEKGRFVFRTVQWFVRGPEGASYSAPRPAPVPRAVPAGPAPAPTPPASPTPKSPPSSQPAPNVSVSPAGESKPPSLEPPVLAYKVAEERIAVAPEFVTVLDTQSEPVDAASVSQVLTKEVTAVVCQSGKRPEPFYLRAVKPGTLVFMLPFDLVPRPAPPPTKPPAPTPAK